MIPLWTFPSAGFGYVAKIPAVPLTVLSGSTTFIPPNEKQFHKNLNTKTILQKSRVVLGMGFLESLIPVIPDNRNGDLKNNTKKPFIPGIGIAIWKLRIIFRDIQRLPTLFLSKSISKSYHFIEKKSKKSNLSKYLNKQHKQ